MRPANLLTISAQSIASSYNGPAVYSAFWVTASLQVVTTGTAVGTIKLQFSNDPGDLQNKIAPSVWSDVPSASVAVSSAGTYVIGKLDVSYQWLRVIYTATSGTGNITTAYLHGFGF